MLLSLGVLNQNLTLACLPCNSNTVAVDTTFPLDEAAEGHLYLEAGKSKGKVLYKI